MDKTVKINFLCEKYYKNPLQKLCLGPGVTHHLQKILQHLLLIAALIAEIMRKFKLQLQWSLEKEIIIPVLYAGNVIQAAKAHKLLSFNRRVLSVGVII